MEVIYPVLLRKYPQPDERYLAARMGTCYAARSQQRKDTEAMGQNRSYTADMPCDVPERLELHRKPLHTRIRHEPRQPQNAVDVAYNICCDICRRVLLRYRLGLRTCANGCCPRNTVHKALQRRKGQKPERKQEHEVVFLHILSASSRNSRLYPACFAIKPY